MVPGGRDGAAMVGLAVGGIVGGLLCGYALAVFGAVFAHAVCAPRVQPVRLGRVPAIRRGRLPHATASARLGAAVHHVMQLAIVAETLRAVAVEDAAKVRQRPRFLVRAVWACAEASRPAVLATRGAPRAPAVQAIARATVRAPVRPQPRGRLPGVGVENNDAIDATARAQFPGRVRDGPAASVLLTPFTVPATVARAAVRLPAVLRPVIRAERIDRFHLATVTARLRVGVQEVQPIHRVGGHDATCQYGSRSSPTVVA